MWSLPNIQALNADAERFNETLQRIVINNEEADGSPLTCAYADNCEGDVSATPYYDIFGDLPKGHIDLCEYHYGYNGSPDEGFFECSGCGRVFIENYTWELYYHVSDGDTLCLNCYRDEVLADDNAWIKLTPENIAAVDVDHIRKAPHLIAVGQGVPKELDFINNVELDSHTGGRITGYSSALASTDPGVREIRDLLTTAMKDGHKRAILILDAAYQFSVSIGVYVDAAKAEE